MPKSPKITSIALTDKERAEFNRLRELLGADADKIGEFVKASRPVVGNLLHKLKLREFVVRFSGGGDEGWTECILGFKTRNGVNFRLSDLLVPEDCQLVSAILEAPIELNVNIDYNGNSNPSGSLCWSKQGRSLQIRFEYGVNEPKYVTEKLTDDGGIHEVHES